MHTIDFHGIFFGIYFFDLLIDKKAYFSNELS